MNRQSLEILFSALSDMMSMVTLTLKITQTVLHF